MVSDTMVSGMIPESLCRTPNKNDSPPQALILEMEVEGSDANFSFATRIESVQEETEGRDILGAELQAGNRLDELAESNTEVERLRGTCWLTFFAMLSAVWDASTVPAISVTVTSTALGCTSGGAAVTRCICSRTLFRVSTFFISSS